MASSAAQQPRLQQALHIAPAVDHHQDVDRRFHHLINDPVRLDEKLLPVVSNAQLNQFRGPWAKIRVGGQAVEHRIDSLQHMSGTGFAARVQNVAMRFLEIVCGVAGQDNLVSHHSVRRLSVSIP